MKNAKHTPGPWRLGNHRASGVTYNPSHVTADGDRSIGEIYGIPLHTTLDEVLALGDRYTEGVANARLVAAAPTLLAALTEALAWMPAQDGTTPSDRGAQCSTLSEARRMVEASIAQATCLRQR